MRKASNAWVVIRNVGLQLGKRHDKQRKLCLILARFSNWTTQIMMNQSVERQSKSKGS